MATADSATTFDAGRSAGAARPDRPAGGREAAASAMAQNEIRIEMPGIGHLHLPPLDQVAFLGGIATLALIEIIEWPVAAVLTVGHILAHNRHHALLRSFGEALDEA
ncbi:MAG: hypothetical protein V7643_4469 [Mycobacterium sp.]|jgi:hypothetical protein